MRIRSSVLSALAAALIVSTAHAAGTVEVTFVQPETFTDVRDAMLSRERNLERLREVLVASAAPYVADGQTLTLEVRDVDLAGEPHPGGRAQDVRVLRGRADWPRITLRYTLAAPGQAPRTGTSVVQDLNYLNTLKGQTAQGALAHERLMLEAWFRTEFGRPLS
jgi:hypothetical protein